MSSPFLHRAFDALNKGRPYSGTIKPFNFLLTAQVAPFGHPLGADAEKFHLIAPYQSDPRQWRKMRWIEMYSRRPFSISTSRNTATKDVVLVKTYRDVIDEYPFHPEAKSLGPEGRPCERPDYGLLKRRPVTANWVTPIGKESNALELVQAGLIHSGGQAYSEYERIGRSYWTEVILPILRRMPLKLLVVRSGMSRSALKAIRQTLSPAIPHQRNLGKLVGIATNWRHNR